MYDYIVVRYGELGTKGKNKKKFIKCLYENIKSVVKDYKVINHYERIYIKLDNDNYEHVLNLLSNISGISTFSLAYFRKSEEKDILDAVSKIIDNKEYKTFKIDTKRADKDFPIKSMDFNRVIAGSVLKNSDLKVDVINPDVKIEIEIRKEGTYVFGNRIKGLGGYPLGIGGKSLLLLSGGIDSPVAGFLMTRRGVKIEAIHFASPPYTSEKSKEKVLDLARKLNNIQASIKLYIVPFTTIQERIYEFCDQSYAITIMRRMMIRIASEVARRNNDTVLVTGESIGQVASQTLESMSVINDVTNMPIIRPLSNVDKVDIISLARRIDTYDISIRPYEDCCTIFNPRNPVIKPKLEEALMYESKFNYKDLIEEAVNNVEVIEIKEEKGNDIF